jgi:cytochrome c
VTLDTTEFSMIRALAVAFSLLGASGAAVADPQLAKDRNCFACHGVDKRTVTSYPSYKEIAAKYAADKDAAARVAKRIREGGVGVWGQVPMPANPQVSDQEALVLAKWVLSQK